MVLIIDKKTQAIKFTNAQFLKIIASLNLYVIRPLELPFLEIKRELSLMHR